MLDFEFDSNVTESEDFLSLSTDEFHQNGFFHSYFSVSYNLDRGTFYMDNGHSFDSILFYGNEHLLFQIEILLFICLIIISGNFLFAILLLGIVSEVSCFVLNFHHLHWVNLNCIVFICRFWSTQCACWSRKIYRIKRWSTKDFSSKLRLTLNLLLFKIRIVFVDKM